MDGEEVIVTPPPAKEKNWRLTANVAGIVFSKNCEWLMTASYLQQYLTYLLLKFYFKHEIATVISTSSHENKKALSPFCHKKIFLIENECKTLIGCLTFIFCQKYFF